MGYSFTQLAPEYTAEWKAMVPNAQTASEINAIAARLYASMPIYREVEKATGVPASLVAVIHNRESDQDFKTHLHNGDPLTARTVHVPQGRPIEGRPPFSWMTSAVDAMRYEGLDKIVDWSVERAAFVLEGYNGFGYRQYHDERTPYLWAATNEQQPGKYVADGQFNKTAYDTQIGCMPILQAMWRLDARLALPLAGGAPVVVPTPAPVVVPTPAPAPEPAPTPFPQPVTPTAVTPAQGAIAAALVAAAAALITFAHQIAAWVNHLLGG